MSSCGVKRIVKRRLCRGDLRNVIKIVTRTLAESKINVIGTQEVFEDLITGIQSGIETIEGKTSFSKININEKTTHLFYVLFSTIYGAVETNNHMIHYNGEYYKILSITDDNETGEFIIFQCTNRGDDDLEAATA